jgi:hypothetical protein
LILNIKSTNLFLNFIVLQHLYFIWFSQNLVEINVAPPSDCCVNTQTNKGFNFVAVAPQETTKKNDKQKNFLSLGYLMLIQRVNLFD